MKKKKKVLHIHRPTEITITSSRGAVESVIDVAKDDKSSTWEKSLRHSRIARWSELAKAPASNL